MIKFEEVRYKNLLSVGNEFLTIRLDRSPSTLIHGGNGTGKSTFISAILFALFGKPYHNLNKPQLVNTIIGKNLVTEIDFKVDKHQYMIRRGIKPNIFEIYQNGVMIDQNSDIKEYQAIIEKDILKMNYKTFCQIVILGSTNYVPFMELTAADRRSVVEDLLDIQIFSKMRSVLKTKLDEMKDEFTQLDHDIVLLKTKIQGQENNIKALQANNEEIIADKLKSIDDIKGSVVGLEAENDRLIKDKEELESKVKDTKVLRGKRDELISIKGKIEDKIKNHKKTANFFENHDTCPTCSQDIELEFKKAEIESEIGKSVSLESNLVKLNDTYSSISADIEAATKISDEVSKLADNIRQNNNFINNYKMNIQNIEGEIESIRNKKPPKLELSEDLGELKLDLSKKTRYNSDLLDKKKVLDASHILLKDTGIKTKIINQYIPVINQYVNSYLADFDLFVSFDLDSNFTETIKSRDRDTFSYGSFSEGQKMRINLSLMFAWRDVARIRNSAATNLLIMDEVTDGSLDEDGINGFLGIVDKISETSNIFVISHHGDQIYDKFHSAIHIEKKNNFTRIK